MKIIITLILSAFLLTSCSNPDTSGGVTLHKRSGEPWAVCESDGGNKKCIPGYTDDFPHGLCTGPTELGAKSETTGCGYFWVYYSWGHSSRYYSRPGVNLSGANLTKKNLYGANLKRANLTNANLSNADLSHADLGAANLSGANLYGANMHRANLKEANLQNSDLRWAQLNDTSLESTNLSNTKMYRASVERANLTGADLRNAKLIYTDFRGIHQYTKLYEADFSHADTYGAITNDYIYCPDRYRYRRRNQQTGTWANCPF